MTPECDGPVGGANPSRALTFGFVQAVLLGAALLAGGCKRTSPPADPAVFEVSRPRLEEPAMLQSRNVEILAQARGNVVAVTVLNRTDKAFLVGPKMVAVIADGKLYKTLPGNARFPIRTLQPGEGVAGLFRYPEFRSLEGAKLVFNSPDVPEQFVIIGAPNAVQLPKPPPPQEMGWLERRRLERERKRLRTILLEQLEKGQFRAPGS
jgi:hypothetical protein